MRGFGDVLVFVSRTALLLCVGMLVFDYAHPWTLTMHFA